MISLGVVLNTPANPLGCPQSNVPIEDPQDLWAHARLVQLTEVDRLHLRGLSLSHVLLESRRYLWLESCFMESRS